MVCLRENRLLKIKYTQTCKITLTWINYGRIYLYMETTFRLKSKTNTTDPMFLSLGPTLNHGKMVMGTLQVGMNWLSPVPYEWSEIAKLLKERELLCETTFSFLDLVKYCGNANLAIGHDEGIYFCAHCYSKRFGGAILEMTGLCQKEEEHYCDFCDLT